MDSGAAKLRLARGIEDVPAIAELHADNWRKTYAGIMPAEYLDNQIDKERVEVWTQRLGDDFDSWVVLMLEDDMGRLVGFTSLMVDSAGDNYLENLHVRFGQQSRGYGKLLISEARKTAAKLAPGKRMYLWVAIANVAADKFYARELGRKEDTMMHAFPYGCAIEVARYVWDPLEGPELVS